MLMEGNILIADSGELFVREATNVLTGNGYKVDHEPGIEPAVKKLKSHKYDLAIIEIGSKEHHKLQVVKDLQQSLRHLQIILTTETPTIVSATLAHEINAQGYLIKPISPDELLRQVESGMRNRRLHSVAITFEERINSLMNDLTAANASLNVASGMPAPLTFEALANLSYYNIMQFLVVLKQLHEACLHETCTKKNMDKVACHIFDCPRLNGYRSILIEAIEVLEGTKKSFKSKEIADLRKKLKDLIDRENFPS